MPTYVYKFIETGETIEVVQSFSDDALTEAVHPGSGVVMPVKKVFLPVGVTFKGGGFYKTDSRGSSSSTTTPASSGSSSSGSDSGSSGSSPAPAPAAAPSAPAPSSSGSKSND